MSYPDLPENRLIVNGVDLAVRYNMVLLDGYTLSPPEPKTTTVEVPGRDGYIDLTESLTGDVTYSNRSMTFTFLIVDLEQFEVVKTQISNALHGRKFNFEMTMDPGYTYTGRFKITSYTHTATWNHGICGYIEVEIDADPYKLKSHYVYNLNATGGTMFQLASGRKKVHPIIELKSPARLRWKNVVYRLGAGRFQLNDVLFEEGLNDIYINSYEIWNFRWNEWPPVGPAKIRVKATLEEGETIVLCSDSFGWDANNGPIMENDGDGYYSYTFPIDSPKYTTTITYWFVKIPSEYDGDRADLQPDASLDRSVTLTRRKVYTSDYGNYAVTESWLNGSQKARWDEFTKTRWDELQKTDGLVKDVRQKWGDFASTKWGKMSENRWRECNFRIEGVPDTMVTLEYDWKDL